MSAEENQTGEGMEGVLHEMMDSMIFYGSFLESVEEFTEHEQWTLIKAILRYGLYGEEPDLPAHMKGIFKIARPLIDANVERRINGKKGGRPKKPMVSELKTYGYENETIGYETTKPNVNVNGNVNVNANANDDALRKKKERTHRIMDDDNPDDDYEERHEGAGEVHFKPTVKLGMKTVPVKQGVLTEADKERIRQHTEEVVKRLHG